MTITFNVLNPIGTVTVFDANGNPVFQINLTLYKNGTLAVGQPTGVPVTIADVKFGTYEFQNDHVVVKWDGEAGKTTYAFDTFYLG